MSEAKSRKTNPGNFFEDFHVGQCIEHATPRTITAGDVATYMALYGSRFAVQSSSEFSHTIGLAKSSAEGGGARMSPVDDLLVFHVVFGKTVPEISLNAVANLGYAECTFHELVYPGDTLAARSEVIGLKENSNGETGVVYVRTTGRNQHGGTVLSYVRWVMVRKRAKASPAPAPVVPKLAAVVPSDELKGGLPPINANGYGYVHSGSPHRFGDYTVGELIDHVDGVTVEEAEHQLATRLYQNTAKVHFDGLAARNGQFGKRLIYGGVVISIARAMTFNGLGNAFRIAAINGGRHVAPLFAGDTVYAWSEVLAVADVPGRSDVGALRLRTLASKNRSSADFPGLKSGGEGADALVLDLDYWVLLPK